jgi:ketosteroid isomerase-like protein
MSQENVEVVRRLWDLWESGPDEGNPSVAWKYDLAAKDAVLRPPPEIPDMQTYVGEEGFLEFTDVWTQSFEEWTIRAERVIDAGGDRVVVIAQQSGTGKDSGVPVELRFGLVNTVKDGRITETVMYLTPEQALEAAGLSE